MRRIKLWIIGAITWFLYDWLVRRDSPYMDKLTEDKLLMELHDNPAVNKYFKDRIDFLIRSQAGSTTVPTDYDYAVLLGRRLEIMEMLTKGLNASTRTKNSARNKLSTGK